MGRAATVLLLAGALGLALAAAATESHEATDLRAEEHAGMATKLPTPASKQLSDTLPSHLDPADQLSAVFPFLHPVPWSVPSTEKSTEREEKVPDDRENLVVWKDDADDLPDSAVKRMPEDLVKTATRMMVKEAERRRQFRKKMQALVYARRLPETNTREDSGAPETKTSTMDEGTAANSDGLATKDVLQSPRHVMRGMPIVRSIFPSLPFSPFSPFLSPDEVLKEKIGPLKYENGDDKTFVVVRGFSLGDEPSPFHFGVPSFSNTENESSLAPHDSVRINVRIIPIHARPILKQTKDRTTLTGNTDIMLKSFHELPSPDIMFRNFSPLMRFLDFIRHEENLPLDDAISRTHSADEQPTVTKTKIAEDSGEKSEPIAMKLIPKILEDEAKGTDKKPTMSPKDKLAQGSDLNRTKRDTETTSLASESDTKRETMPENSMSVEEHPLVEKEPKTAETQTAERKTAEPTRKMLGPLDASPLAMGVPDATMGVPDAAMGIPDAAMGVPDAASGIPDAPMGVPDAVMGLPNAAMGMFGHGLHVAPYLIPKIAMDNIMLAHNIKLHQMKHFLKTMAFLMGGQPLFYDKMAYYMKMYPKFSMMGIPGMIPHTMELEMMGPYNLAAAQAAAQTDAAAAEVAGGAVELPPVISEQPVAKAAPAPTVVPCVIAPCPMFLRARRSVRSGRDSMYQRPFRPSASQGKELGGSAYDAEFQSVLETDQEVSQKREKFPSTVKTLHSNYAEQPLFYEKAEPRWYSKYYAKPLTLNIRDSTEQKSREEEFGTMLLPHKEIFQPNVKNRQEENIRSREIPDTFQRDTYQYKPDSEFKEILEESLSMKRKTKETPAAALQSEQMLPEESFGPPSFGVNPFIGRMSSSLLTEREFPVSSDRVLQRGKRSLWDSSARNAFNPELEQPVAGVADDAMVGLASSTGGKAKRSRSGGSRHGGRHKHKIGSPRKIASKDSRSKKENPEITIEDNVKEYSRRQEINPKRMPFLDPSMMGDHHDNHFHRRELGNDFKFDH